MNYHLKTQSVKNLKLIEQNLTESNQKTEISDPRILMKLPLEQRKIILAQQAENILSFYENDQNWQQLQTWDDHD